MVNHSYNIPYTIYYADKDNLKTKKLLIEIVLQVSANFYLLGEQQLVF